MKKIILIIFLLNLLILFSIFISFPVIGKPSVNPVNTNLERKISNLSDRFTSLESNWGRFQIGGGFQIGASTTMAPDITSDNLKLDQRLDLFFNAFIDRNTQLYFKMLHPGIWGSASYPLLAAPQVNEAYLQFEYPGILNYIGRFKFSLGPLGLIADFMTNDPLEGIAIQHAINKFLLVGLYSPIYSELGEDYFAARIGWTNQKAAIGLNIVPNGITGEKNISLDYTHDFANSNISSELSFYSFESQDPNLNIQWTPAVLISFSRQFPGRVRTSENYLQIKTGYISPDFRPAYSSLAHSSGGFREWFLPNTKGIDLFLQTKLKNSLQLNNRLAAFMPVENRNQPDISYHMLTSFTKSFSSVNQINFGIELKTITEETWASQIFATWNLQF